MAFLNFRGLFESIFGKRPASGSNLPAFRLLASYDSSFTPFNGRAWDIATVRSAVDAWARNAAKIQPRHIRNMGGARETVSDSVERILQTRPNPYMTAYAFYYRVAAQFIVYNNAFILPIFDGGKLTALYPINASRVDLVEDMGGMYARLTFATGNVYTVPYEHLVHLRRHYLDNDIFGDDIKKGKVKKDKDGRSVSVYPQGTRKRRGRSTRNAEIAFINEYGAPGRHIAARPAIDAANKKKESEAVDAGERVYNAYLDSRNL